MKETKTGPVRYVPADPALNYPVFRIRLPPKHIPISSLAEYHEVA